ncbi:MAG: peptide chain release factor N(5)-glutamine methyltransferase [Mesorhizobium sp.]
MSCAPEREAEAADASLPDGCVTLAELHREARRRLTEAGIAEAALDARLLVEHFSGTTRTQAIAEPGRRIEPAAIAAVDSALARRLAGEPVHRIIGFREFYGLRLGLSAGTLEPRPDTETLVEAVLPLVRATVARQGRCSILDLGTGTGAVALALLSAVADATATGVDICDDALGTAMRNAAQLGLADRFTALKSDWFSKITGRYDVIVSNPPYIKSRDIESLQAEVRGFDPHRALDGGNDGLDVYRILAAGVRGYLEAGGLVAVEIGSTQKADVTDLFRQAGFTLIGAYRDLGANDRALVFADA